MSSLSMVEAKLPPGFRFHPRDDELVCDYLFNKWNGSESPLLTDVDLNKCEPWDIPACVGGKEWYFYSQRDRKYATGLRTNRATVSGYWKATGKDRPVVRRGSLVGMRKTLVFYQGRAPKGKKTDWVMHEFRIEGPFGPPKLSSSSKEDWVLCRVFFKSKELTGHAKSSTENEESNSYDEATGSSSLPPLMDSYITFDQTQHNHAHHHHNSNTPTNNNENNNNNNNTPNEYQQVPCFSNTFTPNPNSNPTNTMLPYNFHVEPNTSTNKNATPSNTFGGSATSNLNPLACDKKVLEAVLSHLTKMETSPTMINGSPSLGEAASSESYLSDQVGLHSTMWNHY